MQAAEEGHLDTVKYLSKIDGVKLEDKNRVIVSWNYCMKFKFGENCLHYAAREGRINICELILSKEPSLVQIENKVRFSCVFINKEIARKKAFLLRPRE